MADRRELHAWYDGVGWVVYAERESDIRKFTAWFGPPARIGRAGGVAWWDQLPADAVRLARKRRVAPSAFRNAGLAAIRARKSPGTAPKSSSGDGTPTGPQGGPSSDGGPEAPA